MTSEAKGFCEKCWNAYLVSTGCQGPCCGGKEVANTSVVIATTKSLAQLRYEAEFPAFKAAYGDEFEPPAWETAHPALRASWEAAVKRDEQLEATRPLSAQMIVSSKPASEHKPLIPEQTEGFDALAIIPTPQQQMLERMREAQARRCDRKWGFVRPVGMSAARLVEFVRETYNVNLPFDAAENALMMWRNHCMAAQSEPMQWPTHEPSENVRKGELLHRQMAKAFSVAIDAGVRVDSELAAKLLHLYGERMGLRSIEGHPGLFRDDETGEFVNGHHDYFDNYIDRRAPQLKLDATSSQRLRDLAKEGKREFTVRFTEGASALELVEEELPTPYVQRSQLDALKEELAAKAHTWWRVDGDPIRFEPTRQRTALGGEDAKPARLSMMKHVASKHVSGFGHSVEPVTTGRTKCGAAVAGEDSYRICEVGMGLQWQPTLQMAYAYWMEKTNAGEAFRILCVERIRQGRRSTCDFEFWPRNHEGIRRPGESWKEDV